MYVPPQLAMTSNQSCPEPVLFHVQGQEVPRKFIQRRFNEELLMPYTQCGNPMYGMPLLQPLLTLSLPAYDTQTAGSGPRNGYFIPP